MSLGHATSCMCNQGILFHVRHEVPINFTVPEYVVKA